MKTLFYILIALYMIMSFTSCTPQPMVENIQDTQACCDEDSDIPPPPPPPPGGGGGN